MENLSCGKVVLGQEEYGKLLDEVEALREEIRQKSNCKENRIFDLVKEKPLNTPRNLIDDKPVFGFSARCNYDAWKCFLSLAKLVNKKSDVFYMDKTHQMGLPYIRSISEKAPRTTFQLTEHQLQCAVDMLNEMIPIYNKYMVLEHQFVEYKTSLDSDAQIIKVRKPDLYQLMR